MRHPILNSVMRTLVLVIVMSNTASGEPVTAIYLEDSRCDFILQTTPLTHELGELVFSDDETIRVVSLTTSDTTCDVNDPNVADYRVDITNMTRIMWANLFFVADARIALGNSDGTINGANAFSIDPVGSNAPLILEMGGVIPGVFEPGETWRFLVTDWGDPAPPTFGSLGVPSSAIVGPGSNASIVANPIPEPATLLLFGSGIAGFVSWYRRKSRDLIHRPDLATRVIVLTGFQTRHLTLVWRRLMMD